MGKLNVKHSISVLLMELVVLLSIASSVPTEPYSTRTTSSVTGGSTLTVPQPRISTLSMMRLLLKGMPLLEPQTKLFTEPQLSTVLPLLQLATTQLLMLLEVMRMQEEAEDWEETEEEEEEDLSGDKR